MTAVLDGLARPLMRGWLHAAITPVALATGIVLAALAAPGAQRFGAIVYAVGSSAIFGVSATYHRWAWSRPRWRPVWRRADHAVIFLGIASTYTPLALVALHGTQRTAILWIVWAGAAVGIAVEMLLTRAPALVAVALYIALGWVAVFIVPPLLHGAGVAALVLLFAGGLLYSGGAIVYATGRPRLSDRVFGPHEFFHACTIAAWACHAVAVGLALLA
jgi:hemolysin III